MTRDEAAAKHYNEHPDGRTHDAFKAGWNAAIEMALRLLTNNLDYSDYLKLKSLTDEEGAGG